MQSKGSEQRSRDLEMGFFSLMTCFWVLRCSPHVVLKQIKVGLSHMYKVVFKRFSLSCNWMAVCISHVQRCADVPIQVSPRKWLFSGAPAAAQGTGLLPHLPISPWESHLPAAFPGWRAARGGAGGGWALPRCFCQKHESAPNVGRHKVQLPFPGKPAGLSALNGRGQINL